MKRLIKTTSEELTGVEKAAILLAEIGPVFNENYDELEKRLHLSPAETTKIRKAMENLGEYNPGSHGMEMGMAEIQREQAVLTEVINYGKEKGIFHPVDTSEIRARYGKKDLTGEVSEIARNDPESIAKVIASMLKNDQQ